MVQNNKYKIRLKQALENEYEDDNETDITFHMPKNTEKVRFSFRGEKIAKVVGELAHKLPKQEDILEGVLGNRLFKISNLDKEQL